MLIPKYKPSKDIVLNSFRTAQSRSVSESIDHIIKRDKDWKIVWEQLKARMTIRSPEPHGFNSGGDYLLLKKTMKCIAEKEKELKARIQSEFEKLRQFSNEFGRIDFDKVPLPPEELRPLFWILGSYYQTLTGTLPDTGQFYDEMGDIYMGLTRDFEGNLKSLVVSSVPYTPDTISYFMDMAKSMKIDFIDEKLAFTLGKSMEELPNAESYLTKLAANGCLQALIHLADIYRKKKNPEDIARAAAYYHEAIHIASQESPDELLHDLADSLNETYEGNKNNFHVVSLVAIAAAKAEKAKENPNVEILSECTRLLDTLAADNSSELEDLAVSMNSWSEAYSLLSKKMKKEISHNNIKRSSRAVACVIGWKPGIFSKLPNEILEKIICFTGDLECMDENKAKKISRQNFMAPTKK